MIHSILTPFFNYFHSRHALVCRFWRAEDGVAAIEAALLFPVGILLLVGITEFSLIYYTNTALNAAVKEIAAQATQECDAADRTATGTCNASNQQLTSAALKNTIAQYAVGLIKPNLLCISATPIDLKTNNSFPSGGSTIDFGGSDQVVLLDFRYTYDFFTPLIKTFFPNKLKFRSTFMVRNGTIANTAGRTLAWEGNTKC
jgi:Flp pilus assembly pilin Flp